MLSLGVAGGLAAVVGILLGSQLATLWDSAPMLSHVGKIFTTSFLRGTPASTVLGPVCRTMAFSTVERGSPNSLDYRVYFRQGGKYISPFHDIPMFADPAKRVYNMVVEVPRWTNAKMEIATKEPLNPIKQDTKKNKLRYVSNCFPHHGYIWNYGAIPQTWEDPGHIDNNTNCKGDNDPIDICEIGFRVAKRGEVLQVKVLGVMALVDEGETDWKLLAIDIRDPLANELNDVGDIEKHMPGLLKATTEWFRIYKIPDGKPENQFAFNGEAKNREFAEKIIAETHTYWEALMQRADTSPLNCSTVTLEGNAHQISDDEANSIVASTPEFGPDAGREAIVPIRDERWLSLRAKCRQAQRRFNRTAATEDKKLCNALHSQYRRHTNKLRRQQGRSPLDKWHFVCLK
ncbi:inorganic pyrophosphatase isoform X3 [Ixodes scapularis]|uniref:inorganic pyrophosphatase isoform X3 n=1 Tax=Ixodes scapularis TaxID=6945 RepID=UPI001C393980|nr:inorganic pyrophosphatase isoform X3 [Ixodes scapularis]